MSTVILAEKPDQARSYMKGLGIKYSKAKATTGSGPTFLDDKTVVVAAAGHLVELSEPETYDKAYKDRTNLDILPLVPRRFIYQLSKDKTWLFNQIKKQVQQCDRIIVATDKDNEGAAIAFNILRLCGVLKRKKILRAYPSALNKQSVIRQFKHLEPIDDTWLHARAAQARAKSDWLIGMNLSRLYTYKLKSIGINGNYAVGRSISTTLGLICRWYKKIEDFKEQPIYELQGQTSINNQRVPLISKIRVVGKSKEDYISIVQKAGITRGNVTGKVMAVESKTKYTMPPLMLTKGDLYNEMSRVAGWTQARSKKTMEANYLAGYQTYPRTDSGKITQDMYDYLKAGFNKYLAAIGIKSSVSPFVLPADKLKKYLTTEKSAGAHLGIIPTEKIMTADSDVTDDQRTMYEVVVRRAMGLFVVPYTYVSNRLGILVGSRLPLMASNTNMLNPGWKALVLPSKNHKKREEKRSIKFSDYVKKGDVLPVKLINHKTNTKRPEPLKSVQIYDKGGLMEKAYQYVDDKQYAQLLKQVKGIGTSATRDEAMASLQAKKYVSVDRHDVISITPNGWLINWLMRDSQVSDPILTAKWEEEYKRISEGKDDSQELINATAQLVYDEFDVADKNWDTQKILAFYNSKSQKFDETRSVGKCPNCQSPVVFYHDQKNHGKYDSYRCTSRSCDFYIKHIWWGKPISPTNMARLLEGKPTQLIKQFVSKTGVHFDARLVMVPDEHHGRYYLKIKKERQ